MKGGHGLAARVVQVGDVEEESSPNDVQCQKTQQSQGCKCSQYWLGPIPPSEEGGQIIFLISYLEPYLSQSFHLKFLRKIV